MNILNTTTGRYPMTALEVIAECPNTVFFTPFELPDGYAWVQETFPEPYSRFTHTSLELAPKLVDGIYCQAWTLITVDQEQKLAEVKDQLLKDLAALRWKKEVGGLTLSEGLELKTDRESQAQLSSAFTSLKYGLITDTPWKGVNGWTSVTSTEIEPLAKLVAQHVRSCFAAEEAHQIVINNLTLEEALSYNLMNGWPV